MIKSNVGANSIRQKMLLAVLLIFAVLTIGMITGCSSGKKTTPKDADVAILEAIEANPYFVEFMDWYYKMLGDYDGFERYYYNYSDSPVESWHGFFYAEGSLFAWSKSLYSPKFGHYVFTEFKLVKEKTFYYTLYLKDEDRIALLLGTDFSVEVSPPSLATVNNGVGYITAGSTAGTGTITFTTIDETYGKYIYTIKFEVVNGAGGLPVEPII